MEYKQIELTPITDYVEPQIHTDKNGHKPFPSWEDLYAYHLSQHNLELTLVTEINDEKLIRSAVELWTNLTMQGIGITLAEVMRGLYPDKLHIDCFNTNYMIQL